MTPFEVKEHRRVREMPLSQVAEPKCPVAEEGGLRLIAEGGALGIAQEAFLNAGLPGAASTDDVSMAACGTSRSRYIHGQFRYRFYGSSDVA